LSENFYHYNLIDALNKRYDLMKHELEDVHKRKFRNEEDKDKEEWQPVLPLARQFSPPIESRKDYFPLREAATGESFFSREAAKPRRRQRQ
jgi:hypothetical protein